MRTLVKREGLEDRIELDSAGILSCHKGELPDSRMRMHAYHRGYELTHRSRPVCTADFLEFDMLIGMDDRNIQDLKDRAPSPEAEKKIHRMAEFCKLKQAGLRALSLATAIEKEVREYNERYGFKFRTPPAVEDC